MKNTTKLPIILLGLMILTGCDLSFNKTKKEEVNRPTAAAQTTSTDENTNPPGPSGPNDPLDCNSEQALEESLLADIVVLNNEHMSGKDNLNNYLDEAKVSKVKTDALLSDINDDSRSWDTGVAHFENEVILDPRNDQDLAEYYAVLISGQIMAPSDSYAGQYQFAVYSDDGVFLDINGNRIIEDSGLQAPTLNCSNQIISLKTGSPLAISQPYFQGPRYRVANVLLWKKIGSINGVAPIVAPSSLCGTRINSVNTILNDGWEVVPSDVLFHKINECR